MDINTLRGLSTLFVLFAFLGVCWWAFSPKRKQRFKEAANLPFVDLPENNDDQQPLHSSDEATREN